MRSIKSELVRAIGARSSSKSGPPSPSIAELYRQFCNDLKDTSVVDPEGRQIFFRIENFPYLIKMEYYDERQGRWVGAKAALVTKALADGSFEQSKHRCDAARARAVLRIHELLTDPDAIHENVHPRITGKLVYVRRLNSRKAQMKIALVTLNRSNEWVLVTSFYTTERWLRQCAKDPPLYTK